MKAPKVNAFIVKVANHDHWALPTDAESYERMVEQGARAIHGGTWTFDVGEDSSREAYYDMARAALRAIGITPQKKGRK